MADTAEASSGVMLMLSVLSRRNMVIVATIATAPYSANRSWDIAAATAAAATEAKGGSGGSLPGQPSLPFTVRAPLQSKENALLVP